MFWIFLDMLKSTKTGRSTPYFPNQRRRSTGRAQVDCGAQPTRRCDPAWGGGVRRSRRSTSAQRCSNLYPGVMTNIAMENGPFIDGLPIKNG